LPETHSAPDVVALDAVPELSEQDLELSAAAVHVADDVERPGLVAQVVVQPRAGDRGRGHVLLGAQNVDGSKALPLQPAKAPPELIALTAQHVRPELSVGTARVARRADARGQVEHDRYRQHVVIPRHPHQVSAWARLDIRGVDDGPPPSGAALGGDVNEARRTRRCSQPGRRDSSASGKNTWAVPTDTSKACARAGCLCRR